MLLLMRSPCAGAIAVAIAVLPYCPVLPLKMFNFSIFRSFETENCDRHFIGLAFGPFDNNNIESRWNLLCWYINAAVLHRRCFQHFFLSSFVLFSCWFCFTASFHSFVWKMTCCYYFFFHLLCIDKTNESCFSSNINIKFTHGKQLTK